MHVRLIAEFIYPLSIYSKVKQLFSFCPQLSSQPCVIGERELSAVTALGLFAVKTRLAVSVCVCCSEQQS